MRRSKLAQISLLATLLFVASAAAGQPPGPRRQGIPQPELFKGNLDQLGLEAEQTEKVDAILNAAKQRREKGRSELRAALKEMRALLEADPPDEAAIMQQADKIGALRTQEQKATLRALLAVRAELTPEQRAKLKAMVRRKGQRRQRQRPPRSEAGQTGK